MTTLLAYGSLCSGLGLRRLGPIAAEGATRVQLRNCRRGFGKLAQVGDRYAMVLEPLRHDEPIEVVPKSSQDSLGNVDALALVVNASDLECISRREGYDPAALRTLHRAAALQGLSISRFLWQNLQAVGFNTAEYRRSLFERIRYTSPHYIPHPIGWAGQEPALTFLPPGSEGSGSESIVPVRVATGMVDLLPVAAAWNQKRNSSQIEYFAMCFLAEMHGVSFADVRSDLQPDSELASLLRDRMHRAAAQEPAAFRSALGLSIEAYERMRRVSTVRPWFAELRG